MVEEERERQPQPPVIKAVGKDIKRHNWALIGVMILVVGTLASFGLDYLLGLSGGSFLTSGGTKPTTIMAKAVLTSALTAADAYAATHDGSYTGMDGATLAELDASTQWALGGPEKGKVAVVSALDTQCTLVYTDQAGAQYRAEKIQGTILMTDASGNPI